MCGIVSYVGEREVKPILMEGLKRLEYRGYDSAGIAVQDGRNIAFFRSVGKIVELERVIGDLAIPGNVRHRPHPMGDPRGAE
jgi:glutamine---fructose-6-phosphate transaminase (isomerizing)